MSISFKPIYQQISVSISPIPDTLFNGCHVQIPQVGFKTVAVVCDGASSNLSMIKLMPGDDAKVYGYARSLHLQIW